MALCSAKNRRGTGCGNLALQGTTVCRLHGGAAPQVQARIVRDDAEARMRRQLAKLGQAEPIGDPLTALQQLAGESWQWKAFLAERVKELDQLGYAGVAGEQIKAVVSLYQTALTTTASMLLGIARADIDERLVAIEQKQAKTVLDGVHAVLDWLGVPAEHRREAVKIVAGRLREDAGQAPRPAAVPLNLAGKIQALEQENARLRQQLAEQVSARSTRLAIEPPRPAQPTPFTVDAPAAEPVPAASSVPPAAHPAAARASGPQGPSGPPLELPQHGREFWRAADGGPLGDRW
jgi:hypothetical protein